MHSVELIFSHVERGSDCLVLLRVLTAKRRRRHLWVPNVLGKVSQSWVRTVVVVLWNILSENVVFSWALLIDHLIPRKLGFGLVRKQRRFLVDSLALVLIHHKIATSAKRSHGTLQAIPICSCNVSGPRFRSFPKDALTNRSWLFLWLVLGQEGPNCLGEGVLAGLDELSLIRLGRSLGWPKSIIFLFHSLMLARGNCSVKWFFFGTVGLGQLFPDTSLTSFACQREHNVRLKIFFLYFGFYVFGRCFVHRHLCLIKTVWNLFGRR